MAILPALIQVVDSECGQKETPGISKVSVESIEQYEKLLKKDPQSRVFAALADAYREVGRVEEAERLARQGLDRHPNYVGGYISLARICIGSRRLLEAEQLLKKAVQLAPENLLAYQLLAQALIDLKRPDEALKAHKMVLFLNPLSERSREAVQRLESLSAAEFDDDTFQMARLNTPTLGTPEAPSASPSAGASGLAGAMSLDMEREISVIDALLVRNDVEAAKERLQELIRQAPDHPGLQKRWALLSEDEANDEVLGEPLRPLMGRERLIWEKKKRLLEGILRRIDQVRGLG